MLHPVNRTTIKSKQKAAERLSQERRGRDGQKGNGEIGMTGKKKKNRVAALLASYITSKKGQDEGAGKKIENNIIRLQAGPPQPR